MYCTPYAEAAARTAKSETSLGTSEVTTSGTSDREALTTRVHLEIEEKFAAQKRLCKNVHYEQN